MSPRNADFIEHRPTAPQPFRLSGWLVIPGSDEITDGRSVLRIEPKAMDVLVYLAAHPGEVVSREDLERNVWHGALVGYDAVTNTVIKLRKALRDDPRQPSYIATVPKRGYQLVAPIGAAEEARINPILAARRSSRSAHTRFRMVALAAVSVAVLVAMLTYLNRPNPTSLSAPSAVPNSVVAIEPRAAAVPAVTVLPFEVLGADPAQLYLARGLTADLIADLSRLSGVSVAGVDAGQLPSGSQGTNALHGRYEVWGAVQRLGQPIKVEVRLTETDTHRQVWVER